ncbi:MAG: trypsin-like peptidase domain-containing protein [Nostoc sp. TH1S01]|nr:trypsin-like peptidase domain-containing protein [Nostoc sp. TH1S01]
MINPTTISEQLLFSTVRIAVERLSGEKATGTGFFFDFPVDKHKSIPTIITNKHVITDAIKGSFQLHIANLNQESYIPSGHFFNVDIYEFEKRWIMHPCKDIDLCAMPIQPLINNVEADGKRVFRIPLTDNWIFSDSTLEELSAVEEILMIGYPNGLWDEFNNLPLIRRGTTATHPAIDFLGKSQMVIDAACFPGSSGSPVLIVNEGIVTKKSGLYVEDRIILLGILFSGPCMNAQGDIVIQEIPTIQQPISLTRLMIHLGYIIKAKEIKVLGEYIKQEISTIQ